MSSRRTQLLVNSSIVGLAMVATLLVAIDGLKSVAVDGPGDEFQRLVGGLGCGPAVDLSRCAFSFDARLCPDCPLNYDPLPGGVYFCPQHACSILFCPPLAGKQCSIAGEENDGRFP